MRVTGGLGAAETTSYAVSVQVSVEEPGSTTAVAGSDAMVILPNGHEAAAGALGALAITGDALAIGYLGQPQATLAAFPRRSVRTASGCAASACRCRRRGSRTGVC